MLQKVASLTTEYDMLPRGGLILCAVSGGADSMCLLHLLRALGAEGGFTVAAAHFNHNLRGKESGRDAAFVQAQCAAWGVPFTLGAGDVAGEAARLGQGLEETARQMRYAFLEKTAGELGAARIATAHNADDNVETLLLHLVRGSGLQGLTGIRPRRGDVVRPLLTTSRAEIEAYLSEHGLPHVEDSTNTDEAYTRNRLRARVLPVLRELNPRFTESAGETIALLRTDNDYLNARAAEACLHARWAEDDLVIEARYIADLPAAIAPRAVRRLLEMMGDGDTDCAAAHLNAVVELARGEDPSAVVFLSAGRMAQRIYKELLITTQAGPLPPFAPTALNLDGETAPEGALWRFTCRAGTCPAAESRPDHFWLSAQRLPGPLVLRPRSIGDELRLPRRPGARTVKKLMIDAKLPRRERERVPVLACGGTVAALAGFGPAEELLAKPGEAALEITIVKN